MKSSGQNLVLKRGDFDRRFRSTINVGEFVFRQSSSGYKLVLVEKVGFEVDLHGKKEAHFWVSSDYKSYDRLASSSLTRVTREDLLTQSEFAKRRLH